MNVEIINGETKEVLSEINYSMNELENFALVADSLDMEFGDYLFTETIRRIKEQDNAKNVKNVLIKFN